MDGNTQENLPSLAIERLLLALSFDSRISKPRFTALIRSFINGEANTEDFERLGRVIGADSWTAAERELEECHNNEIKVCSFLCPEYPHRLRQIYDPPPLIYYRGKLPQAIQIAIVGSRVPTKYGERVAFELGREITISSAAVVSGLALGIDTCAHRGALAGAAMGVEGADCYHPGVAILGSGLLEILPRANLALANTLIERGGAVVSEFSLRTSGRPENFPRRNRIISGMSDAVVVVEAKEKSGALITARLAAEQGRNVFSVPGPIDSVLSQGTNKLIFDGAQIFRSISDLGSVVPSLGRESVRGDVRKERGKKISEAATGAQAKTEAARVGVGKGLDCEQTEEEKAVLEKLSSRGLSSFDELVGELEIDPGVLRSLLLQLEIKELIYSPFPDGFQVALTL